MNITNANQRWLVAAAVTIVACIGAESATAQPGSSDTGVELEVLTRGPVHEAFAETVTFDPQPGVVVSKNPPAPIEELPPDNRPEGSNVSWIPGYWAWDDDNSDFLWVSGTWRVLPPGRQWISGYWGETQQGAQWTSGYWADADQTEVEYLPEPPETVESGPNVAASSESDIWLPGCWVWQQNRYSWRPGFWSAAHENWVWIPAHYQWAPRGYVFVDGYWDYGIDRRGVLFAPVNFNRNVYGRRGFSYTPSTAINLGVFARHLFLRPNYGHYYFGDYYGSRYSNIGFSPWFSYHSSRFGYDPFYAHQRWHHRNDRRWEQQIQSNFSNLVQNREARPPRTFLAQQELNTRSTTSDTQTILAAPFEEVVNSKDGRMQFQPVDQAEREKVSQQTRDFQKFREERQKLEASAINPTAEASDQKPGPSRVKIPTSPAVGNPSQKLGKANSPPEKQQVPELDSKIKPKPRQDRGKPVLGETPRRTNPQDSPENRPKRGTKPKTADTPKGPSREKSPRENAPEVKSPRERAPEVKSPRNKSPEEKSPRERAPEVKSPRNKSPEVKSPRERAPEVKSPRNKSPEVKSPRERTPEVKSPRNKSPEVKSPQERAPGKSPGKGKEKPKN